MPDLEAIRARLACDWDGDLDGAPQDVRDLVAVLNLAAQLAYDKREIAALFEADHDGWKRRASTAEAEVARMHDWFPCDGHCVDAPEEDCSRHGRKPSEIWAIVTEVQGQRDAAQAQVAAVRAYASKLDREANAFEAGSAAWQRDIARGFLKALDGPAPAVAAPSWDEAVASATAWSRPTPPEAHPFAPTRGPDAFGGKCGRCGGPGGAPWHGTPPPVVLCTTGDCPRPTNPASRLDVGPPLAPHSFIPGPAIKTRCRHRALDPDLGRDRYCWEPADHPVHAVDATGGP